MNRSLKLTLVALVAVPVAALAADSTQLSAGRWEEKMTVQSATLGGQPVPPSALGSPGAPEFTCIPAEEAADPALYFKKSQDQGCGTPEGTVSGGTIDIAGTCTVPDVGAMSLRLQGSYGGATYRGIATATMQANGQPLIVTTLIEGRHVGECTGEEDK